VKSERSLPPADTLDRYLDFIFEVTLLARALAWQNASQEQIADLMDAIHNLPALMRDWGRFDAVRFRHSLKGYDQRWHKDEGRTLLKMFEDCVSRR
jgi:hypothetical protein